MKRILLLVSLFLLPSLLMAQKTVRPPIWGIAKMTFLVSDFKLARDYYGRFLGFDEAFSYNTALGKAISFKVNDRQFLEFIEDKDAKSKARLVSVSFETENVENMRVYLHSRSVPVPESVAIDGAGNEVILVFDDSGVPIEFIKYGANSLHIKSKGKFLSPNRISQKLHHVGLYCKEVIDNPPFYTDILGFKEMFRYPEDKNEKIFMNYLHIAEGTENIEHYPNNDVNFSHPCFQVNDMQETIYILQSRRLTEVLNRPTIGKTNRWLLNLRTPDGTKVEFTEPYTIK
jgi:catechol 2,3-dioxygenase-like lactoylglutathione lyase family enzyme